MVKIPKGSFQFIFSLLILSVIIRCNGPQKESATKKSPRIRKEIQLASPKMNSTFNKGQEIVFELTAKKDVSIDSVEIAGPESSKVFQGNTGFWGSQNNRLGIPKIKITVYFDGKSEIINPKVRITADVSAEEYSYRLLDSYPHDESAYVQGLFFWDDLLIESNGQKGNSSIRIIDSSSGEILRNVDVEDRYFAEGATVWRDKIYQLTWQANKVFCYDRDLELLATYTYPGAGWGLTTWGDTLLLSDGTETIYYINPLDFTEIDRIQVYDDKSKQDNLNELEMINGLLYANIYGKDQIAVIKPSTGQLVARINFDGLIDRDRFRGIDYALNGIAIDQNGEVYVTAKWHPYLYKVEIIPNTTL